ncbi:MAG TPA: cyclodeaminase/cyclohydrolase family protein [Thermomicrobiales bacterium]|nr:cyclodeaminase/cyclohydrolase family protein [Thermomicrobiales bacterium]
MGETAETARPACTADTVAGYLDRLASGAPAPGGGSVAALTAAQGAALLAMVANLTVGRPRFKEHDAEVRAVLVEAERLRADCTAAIDRDAAVLGALIAAYKLPRGTEEERAARASTLQARLREATETPLTVLRAARALPPLCARLLPVGNPTAVSDIGVAAACALAAYHSAELNVRINLGQLANAAYVAAVREEVAATGAAIADEVAAILTGVRERMQ